MENTEEQIEQGTPISAVELHVVETGEFPDDHYLLKGMENFAVGDKVSVLVDTPTGKPVEGTIVSMSKVPGRLITVQLDNGWEWNTLPLNILKV